MSEVGPGVGSSDDAGPASRPIPHPQFRTGRSGFASGLALSSDGVSWSNRSTSSRRASTISASVTRRMATATSDPAYFITLIHGTWATGAVWTREGTALRRSPVRSVGPVESIALVHVVRSQYSRGAAPGRGGVEGLHPRLSREAPPDSRHYLVAHSHGGNVALYGLRDFEENSIVPLDLDRGRGGQMTTEPSLTTRYSRPGLLRACRGVIPVFHSVADTAMKIREPA